MITGRVALVAPEKIGLGLTVFVGIEAADRTPEWREAFAGLLSGCPQVVETHRMAGEVDYLLKVVVPDMPAYDDFYRNLTHRLPCRNGTSEFSIEPIKTTILLPIDTTTALTRRTEVFRGEARQAAGKTTPIVRLSGSERGPTGQAHCRCPALMM